MPPAHVFIADAYDGIQRAALTSGRVLYPCRVHEPCVQITPSFLGQRRVDHGRCRRRDRESLREKSAVLRDLNSVVGCDGVRMVTKMNRRKETRAKS